MTDTTYDGWIAVMADSDGFVMADEDVHGWANAQAKGAPYWRTDSGPREIRIVKDSALPVPQSDDPDEEFYRLPSSYYSDDVFLERDDLEYEEPATVALLWQRAKAAAAGLNAAEATS